MSTHYNIHGDNIVECQRTLTLLLDGLHEDIVNVSGPHDQLVCPAYRIDLPAIRKKLTFTFLPGFGRWNEDVLHHLRSLGAPLREAADAIVTTRTAQGESVLFAVEFCGALPAGNQAWQRSGRAFSFGVAGIPFLYVSELGGFELDANRQRKASRMPNPAVPYSYISFSRERNTPVMPIFIPAPGADDQSKSKFDTEFAVHELRRLIRSITLGEPYEDVIQGLQGKAISFVKKRSQEMRSGESLSPRRWQAAFDSLNNKGTLSEYLLLDIRQPWTKTAYISRLTTRAKALMGLARKYGIGLTSTRLPMCLLGPSQRQTFVPELTSLYDHGLDANFVRWLSRPKPLAICWVMGFKPGGDDARPDRGLPPFVRMLIGSAHDMMTIVYGPAPTATWTELDRDPHALAEKNGLWEAILATSNALLVESATDTGVTRFGYTREHWHQQSTGRRRSTRLRVRPIPTRLGEHDVDTTLHILFTTLPSRNIFEGMCNPPGGDWSGVSIIHPETGTEYRWLSLPRVSGPGTKRPDHVFQLLALTKQPIILSIESKSVPMRVEDSIGTKLNRYITNLFDHEPDIERIAGQNVWHHTRNQSRIPELEFASGTAFISDSSQNDGSAIRRSKTDIVFAVSFYDDGKRCKIELWAATSMGRKIARFLLKSENRSRLIDVTVNNLPQ